MWTQRSSNDCAEFALVIIGTNGIPHTGAASGGTNCGEVV